MAVEKAIVSLQVPHLQAEQVLFGDHGGDFVASKVVKSQRFDVALSIVCLIDHDEAADGKLADPSDQLLVNDFLVLVMVAVHDEAFEGIEARGGEDTVLEPWHNEADAILAHPVDALNIGTLSLVSDKDIDACADNFKLMAITISVQIARQCLANEVDLLHLLRRLRDELFSREAVS